MSVPPSISRNFSSTSISSESMQAAPLLTKKEEFDAKIQGIRAQLFNITPRLDEPRTPTQSRLLSFLHTTTRERHATTRQLHSESTKLAQSFSRVSGQLATYEKRIKQTKAELAAEKTALPAQEKAAQFTGSTKYVEAGKRNIQKLETKLMHYESEQKAIKGEADILKTKLQEQSNKIEQLSKKNTRLQENFNKQYELAGNVRLSRMSIKEQSKELVRSPELKDLTSRLKTLEKECGVPLSSKEREAKQEQLESIKKEFEALHKEPKPSIGKRLSAVFTRVRSASAPPASEQATPMTRTRSASAPSQDPLREAFNKLTDKAIAKELAPLFKTLEHNANPSADDLYALKNALLQKMKQSPAAKKSLQQALHSLNPLIAKENDTYVKNHQSAHLTPLIRDLPDLNKVKLSIIEIGTTEVSFNKGLKDYKVFLDDLYTQNLISNEDHAILTRGLQETIHSSDALIKRLMPNQGDKPIDLDSFGEDPIHSIFEALGRSSFATHMDHLGTVTDNYGQALGVIERLTKDSPARQAILQFEASNTTGNLASFAILSPQRSMRYKSLIEASSGYAKKNPEIKQEFDRLLSTISPLVAELNAR